MRPHELLSGRVAHGLAPAADGDLGEAEEPLGHGPTEPGAAAGDQEFFARKQTIDEHGRSLPGSTPAIGGRVEGYGVTRTRFRPVREELR